YGACCVDDFTAKKLCVDLLIHYGHSCLIPINQTEGIKVLYIFVDIQIDPKHFLETIKLNFGLSKKLCLISTVQFLTTLQGIYIELETLGYSVILPQSKPLSKGEVLGCTAAKLKICDSSATTIIIYLGDGRFHLEAMMIANPNIQAYKYDPYSKKFTEEFYDNDSMNSIRKSKVENCKNAKNFGVVMGTLGRQGNPKIVDYLIKQLIKNNKKVATILLSEIFPKKLDLFQSIDAFVQIACPRLSIDWGTA
nr:putative diphthamide biosynthesis protein 1 [Cucujiformia]